MPFELVDESFVGDIYDKRLTINLPSFPFFSVSCETCCDWAISDQNEITSLYDVISKWTVTPVDVFPLVDIPESVASARECERISINHFYCRDRKWALLFFFLVRLNVFIGMKCCLFT